jgi:hypothetical protein
MANRKLEKYTVTEIILEYARAAEEYGRSLGLSHKPTNREAKIIANCYRELRSRGKENQIALLNLLDGDNEDSVKCWVGAHALEFAPVVGERVLTELAQKTNVIGFMAEETLRIWRYGELKFT